MKADRSRRFYLATILGCAVMMTAGTAVSSVIASGVLYLTLTAGVLAFVAVLLCTSLLSGINKGTLLTSALAAGGAMAATTMFADRILARVDDILTIVFVYAPLALISLSALLLYGTGRSPSRS